MREVRPKSAQLDGTHGLTQYGYVLTHLGEVSWGICSLIYSPQAVFFDLYFDIFSTLQIISSELTIAVLTEGLSKFKEWLNPPGKVVLKFSPFDEL